MVDLLSSGLAVAIVQLLIAIIKRIKPSKNSKALKSLLRDRITNLCLSALYNNKMTNFDYQNLMYLYQSYKDLDGNSYIQGLIERVQQEVIIEKNY